MTIHNTSKKYSNLRNNWYRITEHVSPALRTFHKKKRIYRHKINSKIIIYKIFHCTSQSRQIINQRETFPTLHTFYNQSSKFSLRVSAEHRVRFPIHALSSRPRRWKWRTNCNTDEETVSKRDGEKDESVFESGGDTFPCWKCRRHDPRVGGARGNEPSRAASFYLDNQVIGPATPLGIAECREPLEPLLQQSISRLFPFLTAVSCSIDVSATKNDVIGRIEIYNRFWHVSCLSSAAAANRRTPINIGFILTK